MYVKLFRFVCIRESKPLFSNLYFTAPIALRGEQSKYIFTQKKPTLQAF